MKVGESLKTNRLYVEWYESTSGDRQNVNTVQLKAVLVEMQFT
jgi:hypothetical protein